MLWMIIPVIFGESGIVTKVLEETLYAVTRKTSIDSQQ
jgi:predicted nucleic acid-binding protein